MEEAARAAALSEARELLLSAEELLPWDALDACWGTTRHDWLGKVQRAGVGWELAGPLGEFEAQLRSWALGARCPQKRVEWNRRLGRVVREESIDPEGELSALLKRLLHCLQPALSGSDMPRGEAPPADGVMMTIAGAPPPPEAWEASSTVALVSAESIAVDRDGNPLEVLPAEAVHIHRVEASATAADEWGEEEEEEEVEDAGHGNDGDEGEGVDHSQLVSEAEGVPLHLSKQSPTGYTNVIQRDGAFVIRKTSRYRIKESATFATPVEAALQYARLVAAFQHEQSQTSDVWISPAGDEHQVQLDNLSHFCRRHELTRSAMLAVRKGGQSHHKGWRLSRRAPCEVEAERAAAAAAGAAAAAAAAAASKPARISSGGSSGASSQVETSELLLMPGVGELIEVEVEEDGLISWRPGEVRQHLNGRQFVACVNHDEGFIEAFSMEEEGGDWRRVAPPSEPGSARMEKGRKGDRSAAKTGSKQRSKPPAAVGTDGQPAEVEKAPEHGEVALAEQEMEVAAQEAEETEQQEQQEETEEMRWKAILNQSSSVSGRARKAPERLSATEDPRNRPLWYRKQLQAMREKEQAELAERSATLASKERGREVSRPEASRQEAAEASGRTSGKASSLARREGGSTRVGNANRKAADRSSAAAGAANDAIADDDAGASTAAAATACEIAASAVNDGTRADPDAAEGGDAEEGEQAQMAVDDDKGKEEERREEMKEKEEEGKSGKEPRAAQEESKAAGAAERPEEVVEVAKEVLEERLRSAAEHGDTRRVGALLAAISGGDGAPPKFDLDAADESGYTALMCAIDCERPKARLATARLLVDHGADVNAVDLEGVSVLDWAVERGQRALVVFLKDHGARPGTRSIEKAQEADAQAQSSEGRGRRGADADADVIDADAQGDEKAADQDANGEASAAAAKGRSGGGVRGGGQQRAKASMEGGKGASLRWWGRKGLAAAGSS